MKCHCHLAPAVLAVGLLWADPLRGANTVYDANTNHLWNRLEEALFIRTDAQGAKYGADETDILYWASTTNLLAGPSHEQALAVLDEFIRKHGETLIRDPLKRALLQRDLWELFDWSAESGFGDSARYPRQREELQNRLAVVIRKLALNRAEINSLPDNYAVAETNGALPELPRGLFRAKGDWVEVGNSYYLPAALVHTRSFGGRSVFQIFFRTPGGRAAALAYLTRLNSFPRKQTYQTNVFNGQEALDLNPALPQIPTNSEFALVRRMSLVDTNGNIIPTHLVETIQMRRLLRNGPFMFGEPAEFRLDRGQGGALRQVGKTEEDFLFVQFMGQGRDPFQYERAGADAQGVVLRSCTNCHGRGDISSINSFTGALSGGLASLRLEEISPQVEEQSAINWKHTQFDWGLLRGLWRNSR